MKQIPALLSIALLAGCPSGGGSKGKDPKDPNGGEVPPPTGKPEGLLLYQDADALHWYDLGTEEGGEVSPPLGYPDWSRPIGDHAAAWVHGYDADDNPLVAVIHRDGGAIDAHDVGQDVLDVSPDGEHAMLPCPDEFNWCLAPVDGNEIGEGEELETGGDYPELAGWLDDGRLVVLDVSAEVPIRVIEPDSGKVTPAGDVDATETPFVSQDGETLAWLTSDDEDFASAVTTLSWRPLAEAAAVPVQVDLGAGYTGECTFASGGRTIVCLLMLYEEDRTRVVAVDVATKKVRLLSDAAVSVWPAVSPDGAWLAFSEQHEDTARLVIVPVTGGVPESVFPPGEERQFAVSWLR